MAREITNHGRSGYRRGCKCEACRRGHREAVAAWRAKKRQAEQRPDEPAVVPMPDPLVSAPALNPNSPMGAIETVVRSELGALVGEPPWKGTLVELARYNARLLDQIPGLDRLDLVSGVQLRLLDVLTRLRAVSTVPNSDPAAEAAAFLRDLGRPD